MEIKVYSIYDEKAKIFSKPFQQINDGIALRSFIDLTKDKDSSINKHPEDYKLYRIATYDDLTGKYKCEDLPVLIAHAIDYIDV